MGSAGRGQREGPHHGGGWASGVSPAAERVESRPPCARSSLLSRLSPVAPAPAPLTAAAALADPQRRAPSERGGARGANAHARRRGRSLPYPGTRRAPRRPRGEGRDGTGDPGSARWRRGEGGRCCRWGGPGPRQRGAGL